MTQLEKKNFTAPEFSYIHSIRQREKKVCCVVYILCGMLRTYADALWKCKGQGSAVVLHLLPSARKSATIHHARNVTGQKSWMLMAETESLHLYSELRQNLLRPVKAGFTALAAVETSVAKCHQICTVNLKNMQQLVYQVHVSLCSAAGLTYMFKGVICQSIKGKCPGVDACPLRGVQVSDFTLPTRLCEKEGNSQ